MARFATIAAIAIASTLSADAFTVSNLPQKSLTSLRMSEEDTTTAVERGVSVDQDGKSNVWAIEPKMEVSSKSTEEKASSAVFAVGGLAAFVAVAAGILTNLPDP